MSGTQITVLPGSSFASRLAELFPRGWCNEDAKQPGGNVYALLLAIGEELEIIQAEVQYAELAQRMQTETSPELDYASVDFFSNALPRPSGMSDAAYYAAIVAQLFQPAATRSALQNAITALTGFVPRMLEPWNVLDTGEWSGLSYFNVDTPVNPARWGNGGLRYQGFIETASPSIAAIGQNNPILCFGTAYWDVPGYFFGIIPNTDADSLNGLINRLRAYGTIVWVKVVSQTTLVAAVAPSAVTGLTAVSLGTNTIVLSWNSPVAGTPPFTFLTLYRQTGTSSFSTGPSSLTDTATVIDLVPGVSYEFVVTATNVSGSSLPSAITTQMTNLVPPSPAQGLQATIVQATAITVQWQHPVTGTPPFQYSVNYRVTGTTPWSVLPVGQATSVTITGLQPLTEYDIEVVTSN